MAGMPSTQTLSVTDTHLPEWTDNGQCQETANGVLDPYFSNFLFKMGIYGWRKRCLYFLIILLCSLVVINLSLTVWIIKVLDFTMDGMGNLRIRREGLRLDGQSTFLKTLYASKIHSRQDQSIKFESARNVTINTRNSKGSITSRLVLGNGKLEVLTKHFTVRKRNGDLLLNVDEDEVIVAANKMKVTGESGVTFDGSIQTPAVKSEPTQKLRLESPTRTLSLKAPEGIGIESRAGDISATCLKDFTLQSTEGSIWFDSEKVLFKNLKTVLPTSRGQSYSGIFEMCSCENGRLFLSSPERHCQADEFVCQ